MTEKSGLLTSPLSNFVTRLRSAEVVYDPYPHYYLDNVFPTEYYQELLRHLPANTVYKNWLSIAFEPQDYFQYREQISLNGDLTKSLAPELREFWDSFNKWFLGPELMQAALESFATPLSARFGERALWPTVSVEAELIHHRAGYFLKPHTDWPTKILALLIYLAPDESALHLGTSLYRPKDRGFSDPNDKQHPFEDFVRVKTAPYKPNSLLAFMRSDVSFHGVEPLSDQDVTPSGGRDLIQYVIQDKKAREKELHAQRLAAEEEATA